MAGASAAPLPIALTMGEPAGIGGEIACAAWRALRETGPAFFVIDDPDRLAAIGRAAAPVGAVSHPSEAAAAFRTALPVLALGRTVRARPGAPSPETAGAVIASIDRAVEAVRRGEALAVVTNPIQKSALLQAGFAYPGHTEYIDALTRDWPAAGAGARGPVMMIASPHLKVAPLSIHCALSEAIAAVRADRIVAAGRVIAQALRDDFGLVSPRLAISGLNPHAGEAGAFGREDADEIAPAVAALQAELGARGVEVRGPLPADTLFHPEARATYDAALCMYHDQALIPAKTLDFHGGVNVTLGLPIVRASPDHGVALDIAGRGAARADSLIAALRLAGEIGARRARAAR